jgi:hypothetical protein
MNWLAGSVKQIVLASVLLGSFCLAIQPFIHHDHEPSSQVNDAWTFGAEPGDAAGAELCTYFNSAPTAFTSTQLGQVRCDPNQIVMVDVSAGSVQIAQNSSGNTIPIVCDNSAPINITSTTTTGVVAYASGKTIYVCGFNFQTSAATNVTFETGAASSNTCSTPVALTGPYNSGPQAGVSDESPFFNGMKSAVSGAICIATAGTAGQVAGIIKYAQF